MEHRAKLIDLAAFLDRIERAAGEPGQRDDFRMIAFRAALLQREQFIGVEVAFVVGLSRSWQDRLFA